MSTNKFIVFKSPKLDKEHFNCLYVSPLARARETAEVIWGGRQEEVHIEPHLREIDLYGF